MGTLFLILLVEVITLQTVTALYLEIDPPPIYKIPEETPVQLVATLRFNDSELDDHLKDSESCFCITALPDETWKLNIDSSNLTWTTEEVLEETNKSLTLEGFYWGYTRVVFHLAINELPNELHPGAPMPNNYTVVVDRNSRVLDAVFMGVLTAFLLILSTLVGCQLDQALIISVLKRPIGPIVGFISQFAFMPLFSYWVGSVLFEDPLQRLGLFTLGCSPGGTGSNFWTLMLHGDLNLSITMTFTSTVAAMGMMPFWMFTLGKQLLEENANVQIPFLNLIMSLMMLTIPVGIGMFIKHRKPSWAKIADKILRPLTFLFLVFIFTFGIYNSYKAFMMMTRQMVLAGALVVLGGYSFGAIFAMVFCRPRPQVIAISIETAFQNGGIAFILLKLSLPTPESDLASVPVLAQIFQMGPPLILIYVTWMILIKTGVCESKPVIELEPQPDYVRKRSTIDLMDDINDDNLLKEICDINEPSPRIISISTSSKTVTDINGSYQ